MIRRREFITLSAARRRGRSGAGAAERADAEDRLPQESPR